MTANNHRSETSIRPTGLTAAQVEESRRLHGANVLTPPARDPWWKLYLEKFEDPIIRILCLAALTALAVGLYDGHFIEGVGILVAILLSTGLSFLNEYRAAREFDILNRVSDSEEIPVIRDGRHQTVPKSDLVVGDIVLTEQGAEIPADARVIEAVSLRVNESGLTGESNPVAKHATGASLPGHETDLAYPADMVLRSSTVADGHGILEVTTVGDHTEIGKTARAAAEKTDGLTPLGKQLESLARVISVAAFAAAAIIFIGQTLRGAANGEIHDLIERSGRIVAIPLDAGQWYCFILLALVITLLCAQVWVPILRGGLGSVAASVFPAWLDRPGGKGFLRLASLAFGVGAAGVVVGLVLGVIHFNYGDWLPLTALSAFLRYFMVAVTVIVVAVPEGLPMCVVLALAYSMRKMTASNNLVRKMHACETIGAASVICSDKTGTLTMNEMRVHRPVFPFMPDGAPLEAGSDGLARLAEAVAANSTAHLQREGETVKPLGNPTEGAILLWLADAGLDCETVRAAFATQRQLTFTTERKFMATAGRSGLDGGSILYVKGAAEIVLSRCAARGAADGSAVPLDETVRREIIAGAAEYQNRGMRVLGLAHRAVDAAFLERDGDMDPECAELVWDGFFAIADPIRPDVGAALAAARRAGIKVKVVTGDNQATAREIARQAGLWLDEDADDAIVTGETFGAMDDKAAAAAASRIKIMSRARPLHKLRLVKLLREQREVVAVTGDGSNDAPALNHADVGLSMGRTGTAVAKEASDIILLDDSFASIVNAVAWGRSLYANIQKFVVFQLTINVAAVGIALLGPFLGVALPLTVVQMLWINLIMDTFAALALASEPPDWDLMRNPPRSPGAFIVTPHMRNFILGVGASFLGLFLITVLGLKDAFSLDAATAAGRHNLTIFFTAFVALQFWNLWNARVFGSSHSALSGLGRSRGFLSMVLAIAVGQVLLVQFGGAMFRVTPLSLGEWLAIFVCTSPVLWLGELWRLCKRMRTGPDYWVYS